MGNFEKGMDHPRQTIWQA